MRMNNYTLTPYLLYCFLWLLLPCLYISTTQAQSNKDLYFNNITTADGLSQNDVNCIFQDSRGLIWLGTHEGLNMYDGHTFKIFRYDLNDNNTISSNLIMNICEDSRGNIWASSSDNGISCFNFKTEKFTNYANTTNTPNLFTSNKISKMSFDGQGNLWLGTTKGLNKILASSLHQKVPIVHKYYYNPHNEEGILDDFIDDLYLDAKKTLWIGTLNGVQKYVPGKGGENDFGYFIRYKKENGAPYRSYDIKEFNNDILISSNTGLHIIDKESELVKRISNQVMHFFQIDQNGIIWGSTNDGLIRLKKNSMTGIYEKNGEYTTDFYNKHSLSSSIIATIYQDKEGLLWIGTNGGGVNIFNPNRKAFRHFKSTPEEGSLGFNKIRGIFEDSKQNLWVGTEGGGLSFLSKKEKGNFHTGFQSWDIARTKLQQNSLYAFVEWENHILIGSGHPYKLLMVPTSAKINEQTQWYQFAKDITEMPVFCFAKDNDGALWAGTYNGGLYKFTMNDGQLSTTRYSTETDSDYPIASNIIRGLVVDKLNNVWIGTDQGISILMAEQKNVPANQAIFKTIGQKENNSIGLENDYVIPLFKSSQGEIWAGTLGGGLHNLKIDVKGNLKEVKVIDKNDGLPSNMIKAIEEDQYGNLWVSTNKGISRIFTDDYRLENFDNADGLQSLEFSELASTVLSTGEMLFGGVNGINVFHPHEIVNDHTTGQLIFTSLTSGNQDIAVGKEYDGKVLLSQNITMTSELTFPYDKNSLGIRFSYLHYANPNKNKYKYILKGFDKNWVTTSSNNREAKYTNLPHGEYTLEVKAANGDGIWNPTPTTMKITILPPLWLTLWAKIGYAVILGIGFWFFSHYSVITSRKKNQLQMEAFEKEKLEDLGQLKMQFFTNISHELRTPLTLIQAPVEQLIKEDTNLSHEQRSKHYRLIDQNVGLLRRLVNQLLDFRKMEQGQMKLQVSLWDWKLFLDQVYNAFVDLSENQKIDFQLHIEKDVPYQGWLDTDKLEKIFYNLLSNAFKFTKQGSIHLSLRRDDRQGAKGVRLEVKDTGVGISAEKQKHIFDRFFQASNIREAKEAGSGIGLSFTKSLVELHNGEISFSSEKGVGTTFFLWFPISEKAYSKAEKIENSTQHEKEALKNAIPELEAKTKALEADTSSQVEEKQGVSTESNNNDSGNGSGSGHKQKLLIVEDNEGIRQFLFELFEKEYETILAEDGEEGFEAAKKHHPDMVISDVMMPNLDGYGFLKKVRETPEISHMPFILLTAKTSAESKVKGFEHGADDYVTKPFNIEVLKARVQSLIENRNGRHKKFNTKIDVQPSEVTFTSLDEKFLARLVEIVETEISNSEFTVEMLATEYGATPLRLNQKLKALTGKTAKGFIRNVRLKRAAQLLKLGRFNVSDVTYQVGFNDLKYFRNSFKQEFGVPPSHFLRENQKEAEEKEEQGDQ